MIVVGILTISSVLSLFSTPNTNAQTKLQANTLIPNSYTDLPVIDQTNPKYDSVLMYNDAPAVIDVMFNKVGTKDSFGNTAISFKKETLKLGSETNRSLIAQVTPDYKIRIAPVTPTTDREKELMYERIHVVTVIYEERYKSSFNYEFNRTTQRDIRITFAPQSAPADYDYSKYAYPGDDVVKAKQNEYTKVDLLGNDKATLTQPQLQNLFSSLNAQNVLFYLDYNNDTWVKPMKPDKLYLMYTHFDNIQRPFVEKNYMVTIDVEKGEGNTELPPTAQTNNIKLNKNGGVTIDTNVLFNKVDSGVATVDKDSVGFGNTSKKGVNGSFLITQDYNDLTNLDKQLGEVSRYNDSQFRYLPLFDIVGVDTHYANFDITTTNPISGLLEKRNLELPVKFEITEQDQAINSDSFRSSYDVDLTIGKGEEFFFKLQEQIPSWPARINCQQIRQSGKMRLDNLCNSNLTNQTSNAASNVSSSAFYKFDLIPSRKNVNLLTDYGDGITTDFQTQVSHLELNPDTGFVFRVDPDFVGNDRYVFKTYDNKGQSVNVIVNLNIIDGKTNPPYLYDQLPDPAIKYSKHGEFNPTPAQISKIKDKGCVVINNFDFNSDGLMDLVWGNSRGVGDSGCHNEQFVWINQGGGQAPKEYILDPVFSGFTEIKTAPEKITLIGYSFNNLQRMEYDLDYDFKYITHRRIDLNTPINRDQFSPQGGITNISENQTTITGWAVDEDTFFIYNPNISKVELEIDGQIKGFVYANRPDSSLDSVESIPRYSSTYKPVINAFKIAIPDQFCTGSPINVRIIAKNQVNILPTSNPKPDKELFNKSLTCIPEGATVISQANVTTGKCDPAIVIQGEKTTCSFVLTGSASGKYVLPPQKLFAGVREQADLDTSYQGDSDLCEIAGATLICKNVTTGKATAGEKTVVLHQPGIVWYPNKATITITAAATPSTGSNLDLTPAAASNLQPKINPNLSNLYFRNLDSGDTAFWSSDPSFTTKTSFVGQGLISKGVDLNFELVFAKDLNSDKLEDFIWRHKTTGKVSIWINSPEKNQPIQGLVKDLDVDCRLSGLGDMNNDKVSDLVIRCGDSIQVWLLDKNGNLIFNYTYKVKVENKWELLKIADIDKDGYSELIFNNLEDGSLSVWFSDKNFGTIKTTKDFALDLSWKLIDTGDANGDGNIDFYFRNKITGDNAIWTLDKALTPIKQFAITQVNDQNWKLVKTHDFNQDGISDLIWRNATSSLLAAWIMDNNGNIIRSQSITLDNQWALI